MRVVERDYYYSIEDFFPPFLYAGFTKITLAGQDLQSDFKKVLNILGRDFRISYLNQWHSTQVNFINKPGVYNGDAIFTKEEKITLVVRTADCLPLFFYDAKNGFVGLIHLGWRSAKQGIFDNLNIDLANFKVLAGVGLRKCCFKVGEEFLNFEKLVNFIEKKNASFYFDTIGFSKKELTRKGLNENNFKDLNICSLCNELNFFSYRRDKTKKRTLSFIIKRKT